jgi:hypothetical protein
MPAICELSAVYRILDANLNRLREALRVIEEYYRFIVGNEPVAVTLKGLRHQLQAIEEGIGSAHLLEGRDVAADPFAYENRPEEMNRTTAEHVVTASFKRAQEAARVIEEYTKITDTAQLSDIAKHLRFSLYSIEKEWKGNMSHG